MKFDLQTLQMTRAILGAPLVEINLFGDRTARSFFDELSRPHRLMPLFSQKSFGAALVDLRLSSSYSLSNLKYARRKYNKSSKLGHVFREFDPLQHIDQIMAVNLSASMRQGRSLGASYSDRDLVVARAKEEAPTFGVFANDDQLLAYTHAPIVGDAFIFSRILGHRKFLEEGIMYRLVVDTNKWMAERMSEYGFPCWALYDMFLGASTGLRAFKYRTGFQAYRVKWRWIER